MPSTTQTNPGPHEVQTASDGDGPLLQRDFRAAFEGTELSPEQVARLVRERFPEFSPPLIATFGRRQETQRTLQVGDEMDIRLSGFGRCCVRVVHVDGQSMTLRTLEGHPEAGRITFGAERDDEGRLVFRIRSRARIHGKLKYVGYRIAGHVLQTRMWSRFIERLAKSCGGRVAGKVEAEGPTEIEERLPDQGGLDTPTFLAKGAS